MRFRFWRPRFRLITLLGAIGVMSVALAIWSASAHRQGAAVRLLRSLAADVDVEYGPKLASNALTRKLRPWIGDDWFATVTYRQTTYFPSAVWIGNDWFATVTGVRVPRIPEAMFDLEKEYTGPTNEEVMRAIGSLHGLQWLYLVGAPYVDVHRQPEAKNNRLFDRRDSGRFVDVSAFRALAGLRKLRVFSPTPLNGRQSHRWSGVPRVGRWAPQDDDALAFLSQNPDLEMIDVGGLRVGDRFVSKLAVLKNLKMLHLDGTGITDAAAEFIARLPALEYLTVNGTELTDAGLAQIARSRTIVRLEIADTRMSDAGAAAIAGMRQLKVLEIGGVDTPRNWGRRGVIGRDAALRLAALPHLERLDLGKARESLIAELKKAHPKLDLVGMSVLDSL